MVDRYVKRSFGVDCFHTAFEFCYDKDFVFRGERHDFAEITMITSGKATVTQEENVYTMDAGSIVFHPPMKFHRIQSADGTSPTGYTLSFHTTGNFPEELNEGFFSVSKDISASLERLMQRLIPFVDGAVCGEFEGQYLADTLCALLIDICTTGKRPNDLTTSAKEYNRVACDMAECVNCGYDLSEFAKRNNISISYIKLLFSKYAGVSPKSYYSELRANEAAKLLRAGYSASEITARMNFSSASYFSLFFKKHFGTTAQQFKRG